MPIKRLCSDPDDGELIQVCAGCGAEHTISLNRAGQKSKTGPFALRDGDTLIIQIDAAAPRTATFAGGASTKVAMIPAEQLAHVFRAQLPGARIRDDAGGLLIESDTSGDTSRVEIVGGTACAALGYSVHHGIDPGCGRPVLGLLRDDTFHDPNVMALRRCNDCGATECLVRTFDASPREYVGTHFHAHRKAVNALAQHAKAKGWSHPRLIAHHAAEKNDPVDVDRTFPASPLELSPFLPGHAAAPIPSQDVSEVANQLPHEAEPQTA